MDIDRRVWKIPASNSKSKRIRSVPLNDSAKAILKQLDTNEYLFTNKQTGETTFIETSPGYTGATFQECSPYLPSPANPDLAYSNCHEWWDHDGAVCSY